MKYIVIGDWTIHSEDGETVYIEHVSGEGGEFDADKFAEVIAEFFNREF